MAENPLLPDRELRALHTFLRSAQKIEAAAARRAAKHARPRASATTIAGGREALLAGTLLQLCPGDLLVTEPGDAGTRDLLTAVPGSTDEAAAAPELPAGSSPIMLASAMAAALQASRGDRCVLATVRAGHTESGWPEALAWAQQQHLPLVLACADPGGERTFQAVAPGKPDRLTWTALSKVARRLALPVLSVDGEDAVAVYRVMQESVLRARSGGGPAVLWAMLPAAQTQRPASAAPVARLRRYLRTRRIAL